MGATQSAAENVRRRSSPMNQRQRTTLSSVVQSSESEAKKIKLVEQEPSTNSNLVVNDAPTDGVPNPDAPLPPVLSGVVLNLSLRWLLTKEVGRATGVCRQWREEVNASQDIWKEVAERNSSEAFDAIMSSSIGEAIGVEGSALNFQRLASGLASGHRPDPPLPEPQLRVEDLFLVLKLCQSEAGPTPPEHSQEFKTLATFCCTDVSPWLSGEECHFSIADSEPLTIQGTNGASPHADPDNIILFAATHAVTDTKPSMQVHMFRRDDGRSICLVEPGECYGDFLYGDVLDARDTVGADIRVYFGESERFQIANNRSGDVTRAVLKQDGFLSCQLKVYCVFEPTYSSTGSEEEPNWLKKFRENGFGATTWTAADKEEISRASQFDFHLKKVCAFPFRSGGGYDDSIRFDSATGLLLVLEGLDWR